MQKRAGRILPQRFDEKLSFEWSLIEFMALFFGYFYDAVLVIFVCYLDLNTATDWHLARQLKLVQSKQCKLNEVYSQDSDIT